MPLPKFGIIKVKQRIKREDPLSLYVIDLKGRHAIIGRRIGEEESEDNLIFLGKVIEDGPLGSNFKNYNFWLDITRPHVIFICGKRGEGKSYDLGVLLEGLAAKKALKISTKDIVVPTIIFDTQDQFWTMNFPFYSKDPEDKKQLEDLEKWGLRSKVFNARVFVPAGVPKLSDSFLSFSLNPAELDASDWCGLFQFDPFSPSGHLVLVAYNKVVKNGYISVVRDPETSEILNKEEKQPNPEYTIDDLKMCILTDEEITDMQIGFARNTIRAVVSRLDWAKELPIFGASQLEIDEILKAGQISIILLRELRDNAKALVVGIITRKIFERMGRLHRKRELLKRLKSRKEKDETKTTQVDVEISRLEGELEKFRMDQAWMIIDEAHVVCPSSGFTAAKDKLIEYVKRGRDSGLSLVLATQQPSAVDNKLLSQLDLLIVHRLATGKDISTAAENAVTPLPQKVAIGRVNVSSHAFEAILRSLRRGEAVVIDGQTNVAFCARIRPRISPHGGAEPVLRGET